MNLFDTLPLELQEEIISTLDRSTLKNLRATNRSFHSLIPIELIKSNINQTYIINVAQSVGVYLDDDALTYALQLMIEKEEELFSALKLKNQDFNTPLVIDDVLFSILNNIFHRTKQSYLTYTDFMYNQDLITANYLLRDYLKTILNRAEKFAGSEDITYYDLQESINF